MLVLTRKLGESILIDNTIEIRFLGYLSYGRIRIAIDAPKDLHINRKRGRRNWVSDTKHNGV